MIPRIVFLPRVPASFSVIRHTSATPRLYCFVVSHEFPRIPVTSRIIPRVLARTPTLTSTVSLTERYLTGHKRFPWRVTMAICVGIPIGSREIPRDPVWDPMGYRGIPRCQRRGKPRDPRWDAEGATPHGIPWNFPRESA